MEGFKKSIIFILVVAAFVLGYVLFFQKEDRIDTDQLPTFSPAEEESEERNGDDLTELFTTPDASATLEEQQRYYQEVERLAEESVQITISAECRVDPAILKVKEGDLFSFRNNDAQEHSIDFVDGTHVIPRGGEREVVADFADGSGVYRYGCDGSNAGLILVLPFLE